MPGRRGPVVVQRNNRPGLVGTMARTAVIAGTATVAVKGVSGAMSGGQKQAAAQQQRSSRWLICKQTSKRWHSSKRCWRNSPPLVQCRTRSLTNYKSSASFKRQAF